MNNNYIDKAIKSFEYLEGWQSKDGESVVSEVAAEGLQALRALQSQPATDGLGKVPDKQAALSALNAVLDMASEIEFEDMAHMAVPMDEFNSLQEHEGTFRSALDQQAAHNPWQPIETAPRDGTFVMLAAPSGYSTTPLRVEVCHYDAEYRPLQPWVNHANDSFTDGGAEPTHWQPLPAAPDLNGEG